MAQILGDDTGVAFAFQSDTGTGMGRDGAGKVSLYSNGTEVFDIIDSSGSCVARLYGDAGAVFAQIVAHATGAGLSSNSALLLTSGTDHPVIITAQGEEAVRLKTNGANRFEADAEGNIVTNLSGADLPTNATDGFLYIPTCNGVPTGTPARTVTGAWPVVWDRANNRLYRHNGTAWV